jgi:hypothetical protein
MIINEEWRKGTVAYFEILPHSLTASVVKLPYTQYTMIAG